MLPDYICKHNREQLDMILDVIQEHEVQAVLEQRSTREQTERVIDYFLANPAEASWMVERVRERLVREERLVA